MNVLQLVRCFAVTAATFGILLPYPAITGASENITAARQTQPIRDLELAAGGVLSGQVVNAEGLPDRNAVVTIRQDHRVVATQKTDQRGAFVFSGLHGGVYAITSGNSAGVVRAWSQHTAPPGASRGVLMVPNDLTARGQGRLDTLLHGPNGLSLTKVGLGGLLLLGVVGTIVALSIDGDDAS